MKKHKIAAALVCVVLFTTARGAIAQTMEERIARFPIEWYAPDDSCPGWYKPGDNLLHFSPPDAYLDYDNLGTEPINTGVGVPEPERPWIPPIHIIEPLPYSLPLGLTPRHNMPHFELIPPGWPYDIYPPPPLGWRWDIGPPPRLGWRWEICPPPLLLGSPYLYPPPPLGWRWDIGPLPRYLPECYAPGATIPYADREYPYSGYGNLGSERFNSAVGVPEPRTVLLLLSGGLCVLAWGWRRRRRR